MECNGLNSNNYRYFRNLETGKIIKYSNEYLGLQAFSSNFKNLVWEYVPGYQIKPYPQDRSFNLIEFLKMQDPIVFAHDGDIYIRLGEDDLLIMDEWLKHKLLSDDFFSIFRSYREYNSDIIANITSEEIIPINGFLEGETTLITKNSEIIAIEHIKNIFKFRNAIKFCIPFKKGEVWDFSNIALLLTFLNQEFVRVIYQSEEVVGSEKEQIFESEYKDNIPGTTIRYYKVQDGIKVYNRRELIKKCMSPENKYFILLDNVYGANLKFCSQNPNNYNVDGSYKYFAVEYSDNESDIPIEEGFLRVGERIVQEEAVRCYKEDLIAYRKYLKEMEAKEYVKKHKARYKKGANRNMTPVEFMEQEQARERITLEYRLVKCLEHRLNQLAAKS